MKASELFKQYIWLIDIISQTGGLSLQELNERWIRTTMSGGKPMARTTFNRNREAIEELFHVSIECDKTKGSFYYIQNEDILENDSLLHWMIDSLSIGNMLMESSSLQNRIRLEHIPAGKEYLQPIINAMKEGHKLRMTYRKFGQAEPYTIAVEPYAIKVFKQRWYLLAKTDQQPQPKVYALDRMEQLEETAEEFEFPKDFDTEAFFAECYGVMCATQCKAEKIVIRAYPPYTNYLRTLPLHHSQKELRSTPEYADFEFYLRPTLDFRQELFSQGDEVEVLEPATFREEMMETSRRILKRYREKG